MNRIELKKMLEKRNIDKGDFWFVFQFVNNKNRREGEHELCDGCVEDTCIIIEEIRKSVIESMKKGF